MSDKFKREKGLVIGLCSFIYIYLMEMEALFFYLDQHIRFKTSRAKPDVHITKRDETFSFGVYILNDLKPSRRKKTTDHV